MSQGPTLEQFFRSLPERIRPEKTAGWQTCVHFKFAASPHPEWTVVIDGARCEVSEGLAGTPNCTVTTSEATYLAIESGEQDPQLAFFTGKIKISSPPTMLRYSKSFRPFKGA